MRAKVVTKDQDRHLEIRRDGVIGIAVSAPKVGLLTPSLPPLPPSTPLSSITSHLSAVRASPTAMGQSPSLIISSVGGLGESIGAMPILPPNGALAICAVGRAKWEIEWTMRDGGMKLDPGMVEKAGARAVLRCPVGWSADHRLVSDQGDDKDKQDCG
jgi:2-oxoisovalerate dehydrogenase E2 component (dihydrolipoyl transacylase)